MDKESSKLFSFKVTDLFIPRFLHTLELTSDIPMVEKMRCVSDKSELKVVCTLIGNAGSKRMRIGCCPTCGYIGYIDRPTGEWIRDYYANVWDDANRKRENIDVEVEKLKARPGKISPMKITALELEELGINKNRSVLEIGSGLDLVPKGLKNLGYKHIVAVDNSKHRAEITSKAFGITVLPHPFESKEAQEKLKEFAPFSIIYSSHVIEHMDDPYLIIKQCSHLQKEGDYLIFVLPNVEKEIGGFIFLYISHLHGFTHFSFEKLLGQHGYRVIKQSLKHNDEIFVVAQRVKDTVEVRSENQPDYYNDTVQKFIMELDLGKHHRRNHRLLWWFKTLLPVKHQGILWSTLKPIALLQYYFYSKIYFKHKYKKELYIAFGKAFKYRPVHFSSITACPISDVEKRYTTYEESPIEIQFKNNIKLFYK